MPDTCIICILMELNPYFVIQIGNKFLSPPPPIYALKMLYQVMNYKRKKCM